MRKKELLGPALGIVVLALLVGWGVQANKAAAQATGQVPLAGNAIPKYLEELPRLNVVNNLEGVPFTLEMKEFQSQVLPLAAGFGPTWVWGYLDASQAAGTKPIPSYIGPVVVAKRNVPTEITFVNNLGSAATTNVLAYKHSVDQTLHWADPLNSESNAEAKKVAMAGYPGNLTYPPPGSLGASNYDGPIPAVVHLHGGEVPPMLDGGPDSWVTSAAPATGSQSGHGYYTKWGTQGPNATTNTFVYAYPNTQEPANIWFHDHTLGATRLNVYAGLAGGYVLLDPQGGNVNYPAPANLPTGRDAVPNGAGAEHLIPLVIQDRMFDTNGQLFFPADSAAGVLWTTNPEHPYWVPEFIGDTIVVNGKTWPTIGTTAAPLPSKRYRFLFLNGSNARTYELYLVDSVTGLNGPPLWVIGTDGGYLDTPVKVDPNSATNRRLVVMPGERYDVIIDFNDPVYRASNPSGQLIMRNSARTPYPKGGTPSPQTVGQIIKIFVGPAGNPGSDPSYDPASAVPLRAVPIERLPLASATLTRQLTLNEVMGVAKTVTDPVTGALTAYPGGPLEVVLNNTKWDGMRFNPLTKVMEQVPGTAVPEFHPSLPGGTPPAGIEYFYSEFPQEGSTELWEIINLTADAHPIHLHLVQFQLLSRQNFNFSKYMKAYAAGFGGLVLEAYGPPYLYDNTNNPTVVAGSNILGGNPNVTPFLQGPAMSPLPQENGWKDTVVALPGQVTRFIVRWAPTDAGATGKNYFPFDPNSGHGYVWHCHIIDHEDNEMMRPTSVVPLSTAVRTKIKGIDY